MNYYEEFGLGPQASTREVRHAYRTLARLLHPDAQPDDKLKAVAERQMKRLNEILETLTDPQKRREYDEALRGPAAARERLVVILPAKPASWGQVAVRHWFHILIGAACLVTALAWYYTPRASKLEGVQLPQPDDSPVPAKAPEAPLRSRDRSRKPGRQARSKTQPAVVTPPRIDPPASSGLVLPAPEPQLLSASGPAELPASGATRPVGSPFAGSWLYTPQGADPASPGRYRATYVECVLRQEAGELVGAYRARYRVPDQAISPAVAFRFRGAWPAGNSIRLAWTAADGAEGIVELTLRSPDSMGVVWWTTSAGRRPTLSSGESVLIRQWEKSGAASY